MKDILKSSYIQFYKVCYWILTLLIKRQKYDVVIIARHNNNVMNYVKLHPSETIGAITSNEDFRIFLQDYERTKKIIYYKLYNPVSIIQQIMMILHTQKVVIDDYYAPLFVIDRRKEVWNIWHSYAIYKKVGLLSPVYQSQGRRTIKRYRLNYERIDKLFVRSVVEQAIFQASYNVTSDKIIIDNRFYASQYANIVQREHINKTIIYAPTFRLYRYNFAAVYERIQRQFPDYTVIARFHQKTLQDDPKLRALHNPSPLRELLRDAAIFMTDYSGLLIEIAELVQTVDVYQVLDAGDYVKYRETNGLNEGVYETQVPTVRIDLN
jgi:hypothetical protein